LVTCSRERAHVAEILEFRSVYQFQDSIFDLSLDPISGSPKPTTHQGESNARCVNRTSTTKNAKPWICYCIQSLYFEENADQWNFMEIAPTGIVHYIDTYYVASWTNGLELQVPPAEVTITDGHGQHIVPVESW
jgi:hypothetical protein